MNTLTLDQRMLQNCQEELKQARDEIHRLKRQHANDECANRMLMEEIERMRKLSICGCGDRFTEHDPGTCGNCVAAGNSHLRAKIDRMSAAIRQILDENGHLADGENCTLIALKRALITEIEAMVYDDSAIPVYKQLVAIGESAPEGTFDRLNNLTAADPQEAFSPHTIQVEACASANQISIWREFTCSKPD